MNAQETQAMQRYATGQRLARCLLRGCVVFDGTVTALGTPEATPGESDPERAMMQRAVDLQVRERLHGDPGAALVRVQQAARPAVTKTANGPWQAWDGAEVAVGATLLVARWAATAPRPSWMGQPEDVALVISEAGLRAAAGRALVQHRRFATDAAAVATIPRLLREHDDAFFTGYALTLLMDGDQLRHIDAAAALLAGLIGHAAVPPLARASVGQWFVGNFYRLSEAARRTVADALVNVAHGDDRGAAKPALAALAGLVAQQHVDLRPQLTPVRLRRVIDQYRALRADNQLPASPELEAQLGLR